MMRLAPILLLALAGAAQAAEIVQPDREAGPFQRSGGTGFYINSNADIITNEHVVRGCVHVSVRNDIDTLPGRVIITDPANDLAVVRVDTIPPAIATLRSPNSSIKPDERVVVMGYPRNKERPGHYTVVEAHLTDETGPYDSRKYLGFSVSANFGNSGGPLMDKAGNVIGVISLLGARGRYNEETKRYELLRSVDLALRLPKLISFLRYHNLPHQIFMTQTDLATSRIEETGSDFIVNVICDHDNSCTDKRGNSTCL